MKINTKYLILAKKMSKSALFALLIFFLMSIFLPVQAVEYTADQAYDKEIWQLNQDINDKRKSIEELQKQTEVYKKILSQKQEKISSLRNQIGDINTSMAKISLEIETVNLQIEEVNLRLESTSLKIIAKEQEIGQQKTNMGELIRELDRAERENNLLVVIATKRNLSDYLGNVQQLNVIEDKLLSDLTEMDLLKVSLLADRTSLEDNKTDLDKLITEKQGKQENLESQKYVKSALVKDTKGEEAKYQNLLEQTKKEVEAINSDIVYLEKVAREKLNRQINQEGSLGTDEGMMWPAASQYVTAYFHDPDYPFRNIFEHPAVDIRAAQGSPVRAAKSGFVGRAKDAGMGYSYIMLVHDDGLSTVYGHVSEILVEEDSFVTKGQIIAYSGGTPGTAGAGRLTTAPHLHFEVRVNGIPVNPLNYLP